MCFAQVGLPRLPVAKVAEVAKNTATRVRLGAQDAITKGHD